MSAEDKLPETQQQHVEENKEEEEGALLTWGDISDLLRCHHPNVNEIIDQLKENGATLEKFATREYSEYDLRRMGMKLGPIISLKCLLNDKKNALFDVQSKHQDKPIHDEYDYGGDDDVADDAVDDEYITVMEKLHVQNDEVPGPRKIVDDPHRKRRNYILKTCKDICALSSIDRTSKKESNKLILSSSVKEGDLEFCEWDDEYIPLVSNEIDKELGVVRVKTDAVIEVLFYPSHGNQAKIKGVASIHSKNYRFDKMYDREKDCIIISDNPLEKYKEYLPSPHDFQSRIHHSPDFTSPYGMPHELPSFSLVVEIGIYYIPHLVKIEHLSNLSMLVTNSS